MDRQKETIRDRSEKEKQKALQSERYFKTTIPIGAKWERREILVRLNARIHIIPGIRIDRGPVSKHPSNKFGFKLHRSNKKKCDVQFSYSQRETSKRMAYYRELMWNSDVSHPR